MAKRFFFVCAGLLCLALSYHLGARTATAQSPAFEAAGSSNSPCVVVGRRLTYFIGPLPSHPTGEMVTWPNPIPGSSPIAKVEVLPGEYAQAILENGDVYFAGYNSQAWGYVGNLLSGSPTAAERETFGSLKARYRGQREVAQSQSK